MFFGFFSPSFLPYSPPHQALCVDFAAEADGREQNILLQFFVLASRVKCQMGNDKDRNSLPGAQESYRKSRAPILPYLHRISTTRFSGACWCHLWALCQDTENPSSSLKVASRPLKYFVQCTKTPPGLTHSQAGQKSVQARYEMEGQFLPRNNLGN